VQTSEMYCDKSLARRQKRETDNKWSLYMVSSIVASARLTCQRIIQPHTVLR